MHRDQAIMGRDAYRRVQNAATIGRRQSKADAAQHWGNLRSHVEAGGLLALTVHQPFAYFLMQAASDELAKRVENRTWMPPRWMIGRRFVVHAGASRARLTYGDDLKWPLVFGAGLGTVALRGALRKAETGSPATGWDCDEFPQGYEWLATHRHATGPICWVVDDPQPFDRPLPRPGAMGFWKWD